MFARLCLAALIAATPAAASALADTHERVSYPVGKTVVAYRPIDQQRAAPAKCHPEANKAMVCEAQAAVARQQAFAQARAAKAERLAQR